MAVNEVIRVVGLEVCRDTSFFKVDNVKVSLEGLNNMLACRRDRCRICKS